MSGVKSRRRKPILCSRLLSVAPAPKGSFKKESMHNQFPLSFHKILEIDIPKDSFTVDEKTHDVPCVFQVWKKKNLKEKNQLNIKK